MIVIMAAQSEVFALHMRDMRDTIHGFGLAMLCFGVRVLRRVLRMVDCRLVRPV